MDVLAQVGGICVTAPLNKTDSEAAQGKYRQLQRLSASHASNMASESDIAGRLSVQRCLNQTYRVE